MIKVCCPLSCPEYNTFMTPLLPLLGCRISHFYHEGLLLSVLPPSTFMAPVPVCCAAACITVMIKVCSFLSCPEYSTFMTSSSCLLGRRIHHCRDQGLLPSAPPRGQHFYDTPFTAVALHHKGLSPSVLPRVPSWHPFPSAVLQNAALS